MKRIRDAKQSGLGRTRITLSALRQKRRRGVPQKRAAADYCPTTYERLFVRYQLDASILGPPLGGVVARNGVHLTEAVHFEPVGGNVFGFQILRHRCGTPTRKLHVVLLGADTIAVAVNRNRESRVLLQDIRGFVKNRLGIGPDLRFVEIEMYSAQHNPLLWCRRRWRRRRSFNNRRRRRRRSRVLNHRIAQKMSRQRAERCASRRSSNASDYTFIIPCVVLGSGFIGDQSAGRTSNHGADYTAAYGAVAPPSFRHRAS